MELLDNKFHSKYINFIKACLLFNNYYKDIKIASVAIVNVDLYNNKIIFGFVFSSNSLKLKGWKGSNVKIIKTFSTNYRLVCSDNLSNHWYSEIKFFQDKIYFSTFYCEDFPKKYQEFFIKQILR